MPAAVIQANYDDLAAIAGNFSQQAQAVESLIEQMSQLEQALEGGGWIGLGAAAFFAEMGDLIFPAMHRLTGALNDANEVVERISTVFRDAEEEASRQFQGDVAGAAGGGAGFFGSLVDDAPRSSAPGGLAQGTLTDISTYQNGVNGWSTISMDGSNGFTPNELLAQTGPTCTLYGVLNLLVASGYDIPQGDADLFVKIVMLRQAQTRWRPDLWDGKPDDGFGMDVAHGMADRLKVNYQHGNFKEVTSVRFFDPLSISTNAARAEQFLVNTVRSGKPVMVTMEVDDSFGGSGAHAANVVGVQTGADGKLTSVLVATNWANKPVMEIPAATFMDDWLGYRGGEYMTVDRKRPNFSQDLQKKLEQDGVFPTPPPSNAPRR